MAELGGDSRSARVSTHLSDGAENGKAKVFLASLLRVGPAHHLGAVFDGLLAVEGSLSDSSGEQTR